MFNVTVVPMGISDCKIAFDFFPIGAFDSIASMQASLIFFTCLLMFAFMLSPSIILVTTAVFMLWFSALAASEAM